MPIGGASVSDHTTNFKYWIFNGGPCEFFERLERCGRWVGSNSRSGAVDWIAKHAVRLRIRCRCPRGLKSDRNRQHLIPLEHLLHYLSAMFIHTMHSKHGFARSIPIVVIFMMGAPLGSGGCFDTSTTLAH